MLGQGHNFHFVSVSDSTEHSSSHVCSSRSVSTAIRHQFPPRTVAGLNLVGTFRRVWNTSGTFPWREPVGAQTEENQPMQLSLHRVCEFRSPAVIFLPSGWPDITPSGSISSLFLHLSILLCNPAISPLRERR